VSGLSGGNDEREQTLNQILTEMDGFEPGTNVIVLAATNRPRSSTRRCCARALRPAHRGPATRQDRPRGDPQDPHALGAARPVVDLGAVAASTPGMTGADLALLVNEAALFAARRDHDRVQQADFADAVEKIILGAERQIVMSDADRERTAYHESGHALVGMLTPGADPVRKISIIPRGQALGVTLATPRPTATATSATS
jgi:cell division protease FtsH